MRRFVVSCLALVSMALASTLVGCTAEGDKPADGADTTHPAAIDTSSPTQTTPADTTPKATTDTGSTAMGTAAAGVDCSKITASRGTTATGGMLIGGKAGSVPGGASVTVSDSNGNAAKATAGADGSFELKEADLPSGFDHTIGNKLTVKAGDSSCEVTIEK